jgi:hypothetical protein
VISIFGVLLSSYLRSQQEWQLAAQGYEFDEIERLLSRPTDELSEINWWILGDRSKHFLHSPFTIHHSPFTIHYSLFTANRSPFTAHY